MKKIILTHDEKIAISWFSCGMAACLLVLTIILFLK